MRFKKDVLMSLSVFIVAIFVLSLLGQKPAKLEERVVKLETVISELQPRVEALETKLSALDSKITALETWKSALKGLGLPDYDSGWVAINKDQILTLTHNLGSNPDNYVVEFYLNNMGSINIVNVGRYQTSTSLYGAFWDQLKNNTIRVVRCPDDLIANKIRVRIWKY